MIGDEGNDELYGGNGNDEVRGAEGNDRVEGGFGVDEMHGGPGADKFVFDDGHTGLGALADTIDGFSRSGGDKIDLDQIDARLNASGDQDFTFVGEAASAGAAFSGIGQLRFVDTAYGRLVQGNNDTDAQADFEIKLVDMDFDLTGSDFL